MYFMAFYFFAMGLALILFPQFLTRAVGEPPGRILGMLRGAGGSIIPYSLMYILVAMKPFERRGFALIIACANILAVIIDFTSVYLKEYQISQAMIDVPFELLSLFVLVKFYSK
jgi:Na+/H+ antiporter NhaA